MEPLKIDKPIRLIELFAGVGSQAKALKRIGAKFEHYRICEFDKYAINSYNAIHGTNFEVSDITKITATDLGVTDTDKYTYIMTYSFPCQDLSLAGKQKGMAKGENTRSGLLWEVERLLNECEELPQILLMENVTQVHGTKNKEHFEAWIAFLESKGYKNYWQDLNAKNYGIPQNRNRCFMVSVLGDYTYEFPKEFPLKLRLKDMLEDTVDEKFYISNEQMEKIVNWKAQQKPFERVLGKESISQTITARGAGENHSGMVIYSPDNENTTNMQSQILKVCNINSSQDGVVVSAEGIAPTHTAGHGNAPKIIEPFICASRGRNPENPSDRTAGIHLEQRLEPNFSGCSNTLTTVQKDNYVAEPQERFFKQAFETLEDNNCIVGDTIDAFNKKVNKSGISPTITTRPEGFKTAILPVVLDPIVCEQRSDEGLRFFKGDYVGTLRTIDACGDKRVIEPQIIREEPLKREGWHEYAKEVLSTDGICRTLSTQSNNLATKIKEPIGLRIRKLTPKECWRLMGFDDEDFEKAEKTNSNTRLYKQAGNSIVVDVLCYIFGEML